MGYLLLEWYGTNGFRWVQSVYDIQKLMQVIKRRPSLEIPVAVCCCGLEAPAVAGAMGTSVFFLFEEPWNAASAASCIAVAPTKADQHQPRLRTCT